LFALAELDRQRANPTQRAMMEAVPDRLMADIVNDQRRGVAPASSLASTPGARAPEPRKGTGWVDSAPLKSPPGVDILDRMMDVEDAKDRSERLQAVRKQAAIDAAWQEKLAEEQARRAEVGTPHRGVGDPDWPQQTTE
jgi:hypothetical protein